MADSINQLRSSATFFKTGSEVETVVNEIRKIPGLSDEKKIQLISKVVAINDLRKGRIVVERFPKGGSGTNPTQPDQTPEETQPSFEIDTKLQMLISSIPIANPGNIITSEYHNALRDAVRALASKIGLSINPTAEYKILTFSPNFLPLAVGVNPNWNVTLNRAATPQVAASAVNSAVSGGFVVQLPDSATILQIIVRGTRLGTAAPKDFQIALKRVKFGKEQTQQTLIAMDLKAVKDGAFEAREGVKLSDTEADSDNELLAGVKIIDRKIVNNETWMYFVTADWTAGELTAAKFEINSIQIVCLV